jgi:transcriptional regulator with XRE-family HTH domain
MVWHHCRDGFVGSNRRPRCPIRNTFMSHLATGSTGELPLADAMPGRRCGPGIVFRASTPPLCNYRFVRELRPKLSVGDRIAWYRRRRGMSQEVLAGMVGRTVDWLSKVENGRISLDRLSVIRAVAEALDVTVGDLVGERSLLAWTADNADRTVPALRAALLDYRQLSPLLVSPSDDPPDIDTLTKEVAQVWEAYQASRYGFVVGRLPAVLSSAQKAVQADGTAARSWPFALLALTHQAAAALLTKLGEADLAWIAAERGLAAAQRSDDPVVIGSLFRSVVHTLLSTGRYREAKQLTVDAAAFLEPGLTTAGPEYVSIYGSLFLAGAVAAARDQDRHCVSAFLFEAHDAACRLGHDANLMWTAFGPTNVAIHRVTTAMDLGDIQVAIDLGTRIDTSGLPIERQVRHDLDTARAMSAWNRTNEAIVVLLRAETRAPEQVRHHPISRQLVQTWLRRGRGRPSHELSTLAGRLHVTI